MAFPDFDNLDYFKTAVSLATTALSNLPRVFVSVTPHVLILAAFGGFVLWNNGVVLGKFLTLLKALYAIVTNISICRTQGIPHRGYSPAPDALHLALLSVLLVAYSRRSHCKSAPPDELSSRTFELRLS